MSRFQILVVKKNQEVMDFFKNSKTVLRKGKYKVEKVSTIVFGRKELCNNYVVVTGRSIGIPESIVVSSNGMKLKKYDPKKVSDA